MVDYRSVDGERAYRCIPLDYKKRRRGDAAWINSWTLKATGEHSGTASVKTYRANKALSLAVGRGCSCQCCIHESYDGREWTNFGRWRPTSATSIEDPEVLGLVP